MKFDQLLTCRNPTLRASVAAFSVEDGLLSSQVCQMISSLGGIWYSHHVHLDEKTESILAFSSAVIVGLIYLHRPCEDEPLVLSIESTYPIPNGRNVIAWEHSTGRLECQFGCHFYTSEGNGSMVGPDLRWMKKLERWNCGLRPSKRWDHTKWGCACTNRRQFNWR